MTRTQRGIEQHRKGDALVEIGGSGLPVWVEQESHAFPFGCVVPDLNALPESDQSRCRARLVELFNQLEPPAGNVARLDVPDGVYLGVLRVFSDRLASGGSPVDVHVRGQTIGTADRDEREAARRVADLYTLCFAHPAVRGVFWNGFWDGEQGVEGGLLRRDLSPTPAFRALQKLIGVVWHTRAAGLTDAEGRFHFRGFYGDYRVGIRFGEETKVTLFSLRPEAAATPGPTPAGP